jgi:NAD(P)-dependent dehydrogenase (short-subunit alcohol dehydrogenase family)
MTTAKPQGEEQKTLILTGASRGIGHATVKRFSSAGWRVITCSRHAFPENCPWAAGPEDHIQVDLADPDDTDRAIAEMKERIAGGKLHALVNNAGISPKGDNDLRLTTLTTDRAAWRHVFEVNLFATIWLARGLREELTAAQGAIVNVTSIAGGRVHPFAGAAYSTSKAALAALILSPGTEKIVETIPLRRLGLPEEVAKAIYYLCTDQSSYVTGAELHINGGQHV